MLKLNLKHENTKQPLKAEMKTDSVPSIREQ